MYCLCTVPKALLMFIVVNNILYWGFTAFMRSIIVCIMSVRSVLVECFGLKPCYTRERNVWCYVLQKVLWVVWRVMRLVCMKLGLSLVCWASEQEQFWLVYNRWRFYCLWVRSLRRLWERCRRVVLSVSSVSLRRRLGLQKRFFVLIYQRPLLPCA